MKYILILIFVLTNLSAKAQSFHTLKVYFLGPSDGLVGRQLIISTDARIKRDNLGDVVINVSSSLFTICIDAFKKAWKNPDSLYFLNSVNSDIYINKNKLYYRCALFRNDKKPNCFNLYTKEEIQAWLNRFNNSTPSNLKKDDFFKIDSVINEFLIRTKDLE